MIWRTAWACVRDIMPVSLGKKYSNDEKVTLRRKGMWDASSVFYPSALDTRPYSDNHLSCCC
jgi:hypothetical protein